MLFGDVLGNTGAASDSRKGRRARALGFERFEDRRLLSVTVGWDPVAGALSLTGNGADDQVLLVGRNTYLDVYVNGKFQARLTDANSTNVDSIGFDGQGGTDVLTIQGITGTLGASPTLEVSLTAVENLAMLGARDVEVDSSASLTLGTSIILGDLTLDFGADGCALTQAGPISVRGVTNLNLDLHNDIDITLTNPSNNFSGLSVPQARNVSLRDVNSMTLLGGWNVTGNLSAQVNLNSTSRGKLEQTGALSVTGTTTLAAGPASTIELTGPANALAGTVSITSAGNATIFNTLATDLGVSTVTGNLVVNTADGITQSGRLVVGRTATLSANTGIALDDPSNNFAIVSVSAGGDVSLRDVNALVLGVSTVTSGDLTVATGGAITQTGTLIVTGDALLSAGTANNITLNRSTNVFGGSVSLTGRNVTLRDSGPLQLGGSTIYGTFSVTAGGDITQTGGAVLDVAGRASFVSPGAVTLGEDNELNEVSVTATGNVVLRDVDGALALATSRVGGTFNVQTPGPLTQTGPVTVTGVTSLAVGDDITLANTRNNFSTLTVSNGQNVSLYDINSLILGVSTITGDLGVSVRGSLAQSGPLRVAGETVLAAGPASSITLDDDNVLAGTVTVTSAANATLRNALPTELGASRVTGNLRLESPSGITQSGPVVVGRTATLLAPGGNITLDDPDNDFHIAVLQGNNVALVDTNSLILGESTVTGTLNVTAGRAISQTGLLTVTGNAAFTSGGAYGIGLNLANDFQAPVSLTSGGNATLRDVNALILGGSTVGGTLNVIASGAVTQSGVLDITGRMTVGAGAANDVLLDTHGNLLGEVAITSGHNVRLRDVDGGLILGASTISGTLDLTAAADLMQSGPLVVAGTATLDIGPGNDITLDIAANNFSTLAVISARNVSLKDANALNLGQSAIFGNLLVDANGAITDSGALTVSGITTLAAGPGNDILLDEPNDFRELAVAAANNVGLNDINGLTLGSSIISGALTVTTGGDLDQTGPLSLSGTMTLTAAGNDITLNDPDNAFQRVVIVSADNVTLVNSSDVDLAGATIDGDLLVQAVGQISDSGAVSVDGTATFIAAGAGGGYSDITLNDAGSTYHGPVSLWGRDVELTNNTATVLADSTATGNLTIVAATTFTNDLGGGLHGILKINDVTTITATNELELYVKDCVFGDWPGDPSDLVLSGNPVTIIW